MVFVSLIVAHRLMVLSLALSLMRNWNISYDWI